MTSMIFQRDPLLAGVIARSLCFDRTNANRCRPHGLAADPPDDKVPPLLCRYAFCADMHAMSLRCNIPGPLALSAAARGVYTPL